jgi:transcriptional antiterminator
MENFKSRHIKESLYLLQIDYPISIEEISKSIGVKSRTLKNDLKLISDFFSSRGVLLVRKPGAGIYVKAEKSSDKKKLKGELINLLQHTNPDRNGRRKTILLDCLLEDKIPTIEDWCFRFNVSRPTILKDLKHVKNWIKDKGLLLIGKPGRGYILEGEAKEENVRDAVVDLLFNMRGKIEEGDNWEDISSKLKEKLFKDINLSVLETFLHEIEKITQTAVADRDFLILTWKLAITIVRVKNGHIVSMEPKRMFDIMQDPIYHIIFNNINTIEEPHKLKIPLEEIAYITFSFIGSKIRDSFEMEGSLIGDEKYLKLAKKIARISEEALGLSITYDNEFIKALSLHLKTTLTKIKYGMKVENPLLEEIKKEHPISFSIAKRVYMVLGREMHLKIPEEEVGYLATYIAMASEKIRHSETKRKKVAIVCADGMSTSGLLFWRIMNEMPEIDVVQVGSYKDIVEGKFGPNLDLIISTVPLPNVKMPYIIVSPFLNYNERKIIREKLGILKFSTLTPPAYIKDIIDEDLIFKDLKVDKSSDVIRVMGSALLKKGFVKEGFINLVIEKEKNFPTGLNTPIPIALPHADSSYAIKEGFSIAVLKQPVYFKDMSDPKKILRVKLVIMPVLLPNGTYNTFFYKLIEKMRDIKIERKLVFARNIKETKEIIAKSILS